MRAWRKIILLVIAVAGLALAALPFWLGMALPLVGRPLHLRVRTYEREGYSRFVVRDAVYQNGPVTVTVGWARVDTPLLWAWRHWRGGDHRAEARDWSVVVARSAVHTPSLRPVGIAPLHGQLLKIAAALRRWLPEARVTQGRVAWPGGSFRLADARWERGTLQAAGLAWIGGSADATIAFSPDGRIHVLASEADRAWRADVTWRGATADGRAWAWNQPLAVRGEYDPQGWLPRTAEARAEDWNLAAQHAGIGGLYRALTGDGRVTWNRGRYAVSVHARAEPLARSAPPLRIDMEGGGDPHQWEVQALQVTAAYGHVQLNRPVRFRFGGLPDVEGTALTFAADLGGIPGLGATGSVAGKAALHSSAKALPRVEFAVTGRDAGWRQLPRGDFAAQGLCDLAARELASFTLSGRWSGAALGRLLPRGMSASGLEVAAQAAGPWGALRHSGQARIALAHVPPLRPGEVTLRWAGTGAAVSEFHLHAALQRTLIDAAGAASRREVRLTQLDFAPGGAEALRLTRPAAFRWAGGVRLDAIRLAGGGAEIAVDLNRLAFAFNVTRIPAAWLSSVLAWNGPNFVAQSAGITGRWEAGRLVFAAHADADLWLASGLAHVTVAADGDGASLRIRQAKIESGGQLLATAAGEVPAWWDEEAPHLRFDLDDPVNFRADTAADSPFWGALADSFGLNLLRPQAFLVAKGTLRHPVGELHLQVARLAADPGRTPQKVPSLQQLVLNVHADRSAVVLDRLAGEIAGRTVFATGRMPMSASQWEAVFQRHPGQPWAHANATLDVSEAGLGPLADYLPTILAPRGSWSAHFEVREGVLDGSLHLRGLALRPIAPLGLVQDITGDIRCHGRALEIPSLTAEIGGQRAHLSGRVDVPEHGPPQFVLSLEGRSIPLVRQSHLLVRADLDLKASTVADETRVTGTVAVTDALLLGDLSDLVPSGIAGAARPPPYFAVETPPLSHWHADVVLTADHTLRARTTLFNGDASASFRVFGLLSDPRAVGQLRVDRGQISLPFATFDVQVGAVRLQADDPFHPHMDVVATARRYDYDLRMSATGDADAPTLTFTSNPGLPSDQILQLVMAGQMPQSGSLLGAGQTQVAGLGEYLGQGILSGLSGNPGSNRLSITAGQELSVKGKPTYELEYRLGARWWLVGEYDEFDDYNAGVRWRVYTKGGKP